MKKTSEKLKTDKKEGELAMPDETTTDTVRVGSLSSTTADIVCLSVDPDGRPKPSAKPQMDVESAVYAYIQALRALGRDRINTAEIADALSLPFDEVEKAAMKLLDRGVKVA